MASSGAYLPPAGTPTGAPSAMTTYGVPREDAIHLDQYAAHINPPLGPTLWTGGAKYSQAPLSADETAVFYRDFARLCAQYATERDLSELLQGDVDRYLLAAAIAKASIGTNPVFNGVSASGNEIGMSLIRAVTVLNQGPSGTEALTWYQNYGAAGWTDGIGSAASPVNLAQTGRSAQNATNTNNVVMLAFGSVIDPVASPKVVEYDIKIAQRQYGVQSLAWLPVGDLYYARLGGFVIIPPNGTFNFRVNIGAPGQDALQLFGLAFTTGNYLAFET